MATLELHLLRHAKSSWDAPDLDDFDRPLAKRGLKAGRRLAKYFLAERILPDLVLCSSAVRTRETLGLIAPSLGSDSRITFEDALYLASDEQLLRALRSIAPGPRSVLVIGHNPGLQELAVALVRGSAGDDPRIAALAAKFPTAALASYRLAARQWAGLEPGRNTLLRFVTPATLEGEPD